MSAETLAIAGQIAEDWYARCFARDHWHFSDGPYRLASEDEYAALGEDPYADDAPLILARESDGALFEVELEATVSRTSPAIRQAERERLAGQATLLPRPKDVPA